MSEANVRHRAVSHLFMPGQTISAVIKQVTRFDVTPDEQRKLLEAFKELNTDTVPKVGESGMIPVLPRHYDEVFKPRPRKTSLL